MNNAFFEKTDILKDGDFRYMVSRDGGAIDLSSGGHSGCRYLFLFILQGKVSLRFSVQHEQLSADSLIVLDRQSLTAVNCSKETVLLAYTPSERMAYYLGHCREAFRKPCTTPAPLLPPLQAWLDSLLERFGREKPSETLDRNRRRELDRILVGYPPELLGELHIPMFACSNGSSCDCCATPTENHSSAK